MPGPTPRPRSRRTANGVSETHAEPSMTSGDKPRGSNAASSSRGYAQYTNATEVQSCVMLGCLTLSSGVIPAIRDPYPDDGTATPQLYGRAPLRASTAFAR